jgi:hypothetical protein
LRDRADPGAGVVLGGQAEAAAHQLGITYDALSRTLATHREAMRVSWYATSRVFAHDTTARGEDETDNYSDNIWRPDQVGPVHLWIVLRDSRGGTDSLYSQLEVTP